MDIVKLKLEIKRILEKRKLTVINNLTSEIEKTNLALVVKDKDGRKLFFKAVQYPDRTDAQTINNEILFYTRVVPKLGIFECIPQIYHSSLGKPAYYLAEFVEGEPLGRSYELGLTHLRAAKFATIVSCIFRLQQLAIQDIKQEVPDFAFKQGDANFDIYRLRLQKRKRDLKLLLSSEIVERMVRLLEEKEKFIRNAPEVFSNQDLNASNIILTKGGQLKIVDSDTLRVIPNPASAFTFLYTALWPDSRLQQDFFQLVKEKGEVIHRNFSEYFRLDFIFFRGSGVLWRYYQKNSPQLLVQSLISAVNCEGIWRLL